MANKPARSTSTIIKSPGTRRALRYAHPFFTPVKPEARSSRMLDHIQGSLHPIPPLKRNNGQWSLAEIIDQEGSDAIAASGRITMHVTGDTGVPENDRETRQVMVADQMAKDYDVNRKPGMNPAFLLHLGDVIYGQSPTAYLDQFYRPNMHYPGKIIAIPGNHDGETDTKMQDFQNYFCAPSQYVPEIANSIYRETMNQPGVYWCLDAPFVQIVGLYSNSAENPGFISAPQIGNQQKDWLVSILKALKAERDQTTRQHKPRKALLFATHHPPFSSGGHSGSAGMLQDIDEACREAGIMPDAFFSGHAHSIQYYTRSVRLGAQKLEIPFVVSGCGGHGDQKVAPPGGNGHADHSYDYGYQGWGYTKVDVSATTLSITSYGVDWNSVTELRSVSLDLATGRLQSGQSRVRYTGIPQFGEGVAMP